MRPGPVGGEPRGWKVSGSGKRTGELLFVGLGLHDEQDLSRRAVDALRGPGRPPCLDFTPEYSRSSSRPAEDYG